MSNTALPPNTDFPPDAKELMYALMAINDYFTYALIIVPILVLLILYSIKKSIKLALLVAVIVLVVLLIIKFGFVQPSIPSYDNIPKGAV